MNVLDLLEKHGCPTRKVGNQEGGEYHSPCPTCGGGGNDAHGHSDRMQLFPNQGEHGTWYCRGCVKGGDAIEFLMFHEHLSFPAACQILGKELPEQIEYNTPKMPRQQQPEFQPRQITAPATIWQGKARELVDHVHSKLRANEEQLAWLAARGINSISAHRHQLGWLPGENDKPTYYRSRKAWGIPANDAGKKPDSLWIPRGIVIPQIIDGQVQRIRIRRPEADREQFLPDRSYHVLPGSGQAPLLIYNEQRAITVIEAELDGILIEQEAGDLTGILALGNDSAKPDHAAHAALCQAQLILVALDFDSVKNGRRAGGQAWIWWSRNYRHAIRWPVPIGKDPGDAYKEGLNIRDWIQAALPTIWTEEVRDDRSGHRGQGASSAAGAIQPELPIQAMPTAQLTAIEQLGQLLQAHKHVSIDMTGGGCRLNAPDSWRRHFAAEFSALSKLVYGDSSVFGYLADHPKEIIDGRNYVEGTNQ